MIYLRRFAVPSLTQRELFVNDIKRRCYNTVYPFNVFELQEMPEFTFEPVTIFCGGNGCGKSTLLNALLHLNLETGDISRIERGKHTTRHASLLEIDGLRVMDTPGFSLLELEENIEPQAFAELYPEYNELAGDCRFQPCLHDREPGCAVHAAVDEGRISRVRWMRYRELLAEVKENWKGRYL